jgi:hypothetical protein
MTRIEQALADLESAGLIARNKSARSRTANSARSVLTPEGRQRCLEFLGLDDVPPKLKWDSIKKNYLPVLALGLTLTPNAIKQLGLAGKLEAAMLKTRFDLPIGENPTLKQAIDALAWKLLGIETDQEFKPKPVQAALLGRELGQDPKVNPKADPKNEATKLLSRAVGARKSGKDELRLAAIRQWIDGGPPAPEVLTVDRPAEPEPAQAVAPLDLNSFASRVVEAARLSSTGRFGDNKVFVVHIWNVVKHDPEFASLDFDAFKQRLAEANNARLLDLSRADMVEAMDRDDVRLSEIPYFGATFHFVRI